LENELRVKLLKNSLKNKNIPKNIRTLLYYKMSKINGSVCKVTNSCILTSRTRGILSDLKLSRMSFRSLAHRGLLAGFSKSSW